MSSLYKVRAGKWNWFFLQEPEKKEYYTAPELLIQGACIIKDQPTVKVFYRDGLFFKWEICLAKKFSFQWLRNFFSPRSKREFDVLFHLTKCHISVTEPVGYACCGCQSLLITRKAEAVPVMKLLCDEYENGNRLSKEFLHSWGGFLKGFIHSGFYFPDFHCGNLLYDPASKQFSLVDVYGVKKVLLRKKQRQNRMFFRQMKDAMPFMDLSDLQLVLQTSGMDFGNDDMTGFLRYAKAAVLEFLPRRLKYRNKSNISLRPDERVWNFSHITKSTVSPDDLAEVWLNDYLCQLFGIPSIHLTEFQDDGTVFHEPVCGDADDASRLYLLSRLAVAELPAEKFVVVLNQAKMPVVADHRLI